MIHFVQASERAPAYAVSYADVAVVFVAAMIACTFCCLMGFHLRGRIERRIRQEYRELFGVCRRSMAQANEYCERLEPAAPQGPDSGKTTESRERPEPAALQDPDSSKTTEFRPGTRTPSQQAPRPGASRPPVPVSSRHRLTVERDVSALARSLEAPPAAPGMGRRDA